MTTWYFVLLLAFGVMSVQQVFCQSDSSSTSSEQVCEGKVACPECGSPDSCEAKKCCHEWCCTSYGACCAKRTLSCRDFSCPVKYELKYKAANIAANTQSLCCNLVSTVVNNAAHNMRPLFLYFLILAAGLAGVRLVV
eukprot:gnl/TRDRNA2_/TRDRNA2_162758_c0_seq1.p1 gnl/TRDRNA2_/TRDRNA2_162758_c0~~gnl/TRDRNA2_/TRDRNA2_162758_c0_seq1.p1  ORF type:complete len:138 (-),score=19.40 gnl/TRDRNA2_/TRDRNA2_162758_c0_seq1:99-512(-)